MSVYRKFGVNPHKQCGNKCLRHRSTEQGSYIYICAAAEHCSGLKYGKSTTVFEW